eukprot:jgi/Mesvir1/28255/Mv04792-RA.2
MTMVKNTRCDTTMTESTDGVGSLKNCSVVATDLVSGNARQGRFTTLVSLRYLISHRLVVLRARLVLLLVISAVIMLTAALTWKVSLKSTNDSFDGMSAQLREDVTVGAVKELKSVLDNLLQAMKTFYKALQGPRLEGRIPEFTRETLSGPILATMWSVFQSYDDISVTAVISSGNMISAYRRNGPEGRILENPVGLGIPPPANNTVDAMHGFVPDNMTGAPLVDGRVAKFCIVGKCTPDMDPSEYVSPFPEPMQHPTYRNLMGLPEYTFRWSVNVDGGMQPYLHIGGTIRDALGNLLAVASITSVATRLQPIVHSTSIIQHYNGRMFITLGNEYNMLTASHGTLYLPSPVPGGSPSFISATISTDDVIRAVAIHLNATYGTRVFREPVKDSTWVHSHGRHYINSIPLQHEGLLMVIILAVPREEFRGKIDDAREKGILIAMGIAVALFVVGGLAMCLSTTSLDRFLQSQGKKLDKAAAMNEKLAKQLAVLRSGAHLSEHHPWPRVDMGTPLEKLTALLKGLQRGRVITQELLDEIHALLSAEDLHRPEFLANMAAIHEGDDGDETGSRRVPASMDHETGEWIGILAIGRRFGGKKIAPWRTSMDRSSPGDSHDSSNHADRHTMPMDRTNKSHHKEKHVSSHGSSGQVPRMPHSSSPGDLSSADGSAEPPSLAACARELGTPIASLSTMNGWNRVIDVVSVPTPRGGGPTRNQSCQCQLDTFLADADKGSAEPAADVGSKSVHLVAQKALEVDDLVVRELQSIATLALLAPAGWGVARLEGPEDWPVSVPLGSATIYSPSVSLGGTRKPAMLLQACEDTQGQHGQNGHSNGQGQHGQSGHGLGGCFSGQDQGSGVEVQEERRRQVAALQELGAWDFDTFWLAHIAPEHELPLVGFVLFTRMGLITQFRLDEKRLANFLHEIARGMQPHPFHNAVHVTDVVASLFHLLNESGVGEFIRPIDKLAAVCAALIHDYKHPGVNNDFLSRTREDLATIYNDQSPLENYHLAEAFQLLYNNKHCNFITKLSSAESIDLRSVVIELVLSTDLKRHFGILEQFKARVSQDTPWDLRKESDRILLLQMVLKLADIGHAAKPLSIHVEWSRRITEECYNQGDAERKLNLDVSPFMDRFTNNMPRSQVGRTYHYSTWHPLVLVA